MMGTVLSEHSLSKLLIWNLKWRCDFCAIAGGFALGSQRLCNAAFIRWQDKTRLKEIQDIIARVKALSPAVVSLLGVANGGDGESLQKLPDGPNVVRQSGGHSRHPLRPNPLGIPLTDTAGSLKDEPDCKPSLPTPLLLGAFPPKLEQPNIFLARRRLNE